MDEVYDWTVVDVCCGLGGASTGIIQAFAEAGVSRAKFIGIEMDPNVATAYVTAMQRLCKTLNVNYTIEAVATEFGTEGSADKIPVKNSKTGHLYVHFSPPCQCFSAARVGSASKDEHNKAVRLFKLCLQIVVDHRLRFWTLENVEKTSQFLDEFHLKHHTLFPRGSECIFDAKHFGCPSDRKRLIASSPQIVKLMRTESTVGLVSVRAAMEAHSLPLPSAFISQGNKSNGVFSRRTIDTTSPTLTSSHALSWVTEGGELVRCLNKVESAALLGFAPNFVLPKGNRDAIKALGNVVAPPQSRVMGRAVLAAAALPQPTITDSDPGDIGTGTAGLEARVKVLETLVAGMKRKLEGH
jgi:site-specific DNA-cytosine methylase